jgi:DNA-binding transcriptional regulator YiaG
LPYIPLVQTSSPVEPMTGAEFRRLREGLGLTQQTLAHVLGKTYRTIYNWETKDGEIDITVALAMRQLVAEQAARRVAEKAEKSAARKSSTVNNRG